MIHETSQARAEAVIAEWVDAREICSIRPFLTTDLARRIAALLAEVRREAMEPLQMLIRCAEGDVTPLPCRVDEMTPREYAIYNIGCEFSGKVQFIADQIRALVAGEGEQG